MFEFDNQDFNALDAGRPANEVAAPATIRSRQNE
jgi:hypothetical protein